jgi:hypothetical protein
MTDLSSRLGTLEAAISALSSYVFSEERDDHGRWTSGGEGAGGGSDRDDSGRWTGGEGAGGGSNSHTATRDEIMDKAKGADRDVRSGKYSVETDQGNHLSILSSEKDGNGKTHGYAQGRVGGGLYHYKQTGGQSGTKNNMTRVHVAAAEDTGDKAGTLRFDHSDKDKSFGGYINDRVSD